MKVIFSLKVVRSWILATVFFAAFFLPKMGFAQELPRAHDFVADAQQAQQQKIPILVFFESTTCPYCHIVEQQYLIPLIASGKYSKQVLFRAVQIDSDATLRDFSGRKLSNTEFARQYHVSLTPDIRFLDASGQELVPQLLGLSTHDFYAAYLEDAIEAAITKAQAQPGAH